MSADVLGASCDRCRSMVQYSFTSTETISLVRTDSPGWPPRLSHSSWTMSHLPHQVDVNVPLKYAGPALHCRSDVTRSGWLGRQIQKLTNNWSRKCAKNLSLLTATNPVWCREGCLILFENGDATGGTRIQFISYTPAERYGRIQCPYVCTHITHLCHRNREPYKSSEDFSEEKEKWPLPALSYCAA